MDYIITTEQLTKKYKSFVAVNNVSLNIRKGSIYGFLGPNGAGKSTMLKAVAGVLKPTKGSIYVEGSIAPLIELGAGFDPELTARENVFMNGAVLGYSMTYMQKCYQEIMDFSELREFEDVPVKNFSSGMYARLGFAIATTVKPDILIIDEILAVGDYRFQEKCQKRISRLMGGSTTVLLVSHSTDTIKKFCNRAAWLENGELKAIGTAEDICDQYEKK